MVANNVDLIFTPIYIYIFLYVYDLKMLGVTLVIGMS